MTFFMVIALDAGKITAEAKAASVVRAHLAVVAIRALLFGEALSLIGDIHHALQTRVLAPIFPTIATFYHCPLFFLL
ncbi:MAG: hypothetical protein JRH15_22020 [Deltaproteobacteria bacterium]|nr:hypothetical protein [Deltaproteobacteria bacterium]